MRIIVLENCETPFPPEGKGKKWLPKSLAASKRPIEVPDAVGENLVKLKLARAADD